MDIAVQRMEHFFLVYKLTMAAILEKSRFPPDKKPEFAAGLL